MSKIKPIFREVREAVVDGMSHSKDKLHQLTKNMDDHLDDVVRKVKGNDKFDAPDRSPSTPRRPYKPVRGDDGNYVPGSLPSKDDLRTLTHTDRDSAFYWSGRDANGNGVGPNGSGIAEDIATANGGRTLEQTLTANGVDPLPEWNEADPESVRFWEEASGAFAENASGDVRAVVGSDLRPGNIWQTVEIPRLRDNPNVTGISQLDPDTGVWSSL